MKKSIYLSLLGLLISFPALAQIGGIENSVNDIAVDQGFLPNVPIDLVALHYTPIPMR